MPIEQLESMLGAVHVGEYPSGHMGSKLLRYRRNTDNARLVVKYAPRNDPDALQDLEANLHGYLEIAKLGAGYINPPDLRELEIHGARAIVMRDLGQPVRHTASRANTWARVARMVEGTVRDTIVGAPSDYGSEVLSKIGLYEPEIASALRLRSFRCEKRSALMLLDFTPDNVFVLEDDVHFLDPWRQSTYLGHPGVSMGQFSRLLQIYGLDDDLDAKRLMQQTTTNISTSLSDASSARTEGIMAFRLGETLQLVLSAHVRKHSHPAVAREFLEMARALWG